MSSVLGLGACLPLKYGTRSTCPCSGRYLYTKITTYPGSRAPPTCFGATSKSPKLDRLRSSLTAGQTADCRPPTLRTCSHAQRLWQLSPRKAIADSQGATAWPQTLTLCRRLLLRKTRLAYWSIRAWAGGGIGSRSGRMGAYEGCR